MIPRRLTAALASALAEAPTVALLGPRQVGKTTLALELAQTRPAVYLDLESEADRAKLAEPELYLAQHADQLVILDEIQRTPQLFSSLRGLIDAGRIRYLELAPLDAGEVGAERFPLAENVEAVSLIDLCEELTAA
jgi:predicted AAA+ superfamily ATPase